jgi:hypothetical protein
LTPAQCFLVLFARAPSLHALDSHLKALGGLRRDDGPPGAHWAEGGRSLVLDLDGLEIRVDPVKRPWPRVPDDVAGDEVLAERFAEGCFGPFAWPESYWRALDHPWTWKESREIATRHQAFVRLRLQRSGEPAPIRELMALTRTAAAVMGDYGALCFFAPGGEALRSIEMVQRGLKQIGPTPAPVDLWTNTRLASLGGTRQLMDTVGMSQLGLRDLEAHYSTNRIGYRQVDAFLRNLSLYQVDKGDVLRDGNRLPGPDGTDWEIRAMGRSLLEPWRSVLQLTSVGGPQRPAVPESHHEQ